MGLCKVGPKWWIHHNLNGLGSGFCQDNVPTFAWGIFFCILKVYISLLHPSSALQPWLSLGLVYNQSPLLSIFCLLHPLLYLPYSQVCYNICIFPGINIVLTFQVAIIKSILQASFVHICFASFRDWFLGFGTNCFYGVRLLAPRPHFLTTKLYNMILKFHKVYFRKMTEISPFEFSLQLQITIN
jgi:hypothetical protein